MDLITIRVTNIQSEQILTENKIQDTLLYQLTKAILLQLEGNSILSLNLSETSKNVKCKNTINVNKLVLFKTRTECNITF